MLTPVYVPNIDKRLKKIIKDSLLNPLSKQKSFLDIFRYIMLIKNIGR
nr:hypothetical protein [uncultured Clostridium sp.]